ncbi:MAG: malectin domain-containing carbohydrate-binding protein [Verrucomicrobiota bacterium]
MQSGPAADPWPRYANPEAAPWQDNKQTGGVTMILGFLEELVRVNPAGNHARLLAARAAGERYLCEKLLPAWAVDDTWGRYFWDWANPVQNCLTTPDAARYLLDHPTRFPSWPTDARNILSVFFNRTSVAPESGGDVYSGAWAYPESSSCCGRSLWYAPLDLAPAFAQYAAQADSAWARELALRQVVLQTYDGHANGPTEDNLDGGVIVNGSWFNIAHPMPLRFLLAAMAWLPEELGASRENHIMRSSAVVTSVVYGAGRIEYSTFGAPKETVGVLRLAFVPSEIRADDHPLRKRRDMKANGYTMKQLPNGDALVSIRHDGAKRIVVAGKDPQRAIADTALDFQGTWREEADPDALGERLHVSESAGAAMSAQFEGNQVRLIGRADPSGGLADVFLDGEKQLVPIDGWNPTPRSQQVLYSRNGLAAGPHTLKIVARGEQNPYATGARIYLDGIQFSAATGVYHFPSGRGPTETQRMIFGYTGRTDWRDSRGHSWRPATEFVTRLAGGKDSVAQCWWTNATDEPIRGTADPELYRYGVHATDFWVNLTVGPGKYHARLKFAALRGLVARPGGFDICLNGRRFVERLDVRATAGGTNRVVDLVFNDLEPHNGIIEIRLTGKERWEGGKMVRDEAFLQALEIGPGHGGRGAKPVSEPVQ